MGAGFHVGDELDDIGPCKSWKVFDFSEKD